MTKSPDAFRTISEVSEWLDTPTYVLRFWESRFAQIKPVKRAGGRRYYRPEDMQLLGGIKRLLHFDERSIKYVRGLIKEKGVKHVMGLSPDLNTQVVSPPSKKDAQDAADIDKLVKSAPEGKKKPAVEVRVVKRGKVTQDTAHEDAAEKAEEMPVEEAQKADTQDALAKAKADEANRIKAAKRAAAEKQQADEDADDWGEMTPDMIKGAPFRISAASAYTPEAMEEIETLYYSLRMARNSMKRAKKKMENRAG